MNQKFINKAIATVKKDGKLLYQLSTGKYFKLPKGKGSIIPLAQYTTEDNIGRLNNDGIYATLKMMNMMYYVHERKEKIIFYNNGMKHDVDYLVITQMDDIPKIVYSLCINIPDNSEYTPYDCIHLMYEQYRANASNFIGGVLKGGVDTIYIEGNLEKILDNKEKENFFEYLVNLVY